MKRTIAVLSGVLAFSAIVFGTGMLLFVIGWPISQERMQTLIAAARQMPTALFLILGALICTAIGVIVLYGMIWKHWNRRTSALLEKNTFGETSVSFTALKEIAESALKNRDDVKNVRIKVYAVGNSVRIGARAITSPTASLYEITHSLQEEINTTIRSICGVEIGSIDVTVDQAEIPPKRN